MWKKGKTSFTSGRNVDSFSLFGKHYEYPQKVGIEFPSDSTISLLGIYPHLPLFRKHNCTPMFIAELFTRAKSGSSSSVQE